MILGWVVLWNVAVDHLVVCYLLCYVFIPSAQSTPTKSEQSGPVSSQKRLIRQQEVEDIATSIVGKNGKLLTNPFVQWTFSEIGNVQRSCCLCSSVLFPFMLTDIFASIFFFLMIIKNCVLYAKPHVCVCVCVSMYICMYI